MGPGPWQGAPHRPDSRRPTLQGQIHLCPEPDRAGAPLGLVKGTASARPSRRPRPLSHPAPALRARHSPKGDRAAGQEKEQATKVKGAATPLAPSFIAAHPPDSGTAGRRCEAGQWLKQPIAARIGARQYPPPSSISTNQKEGGGGRSLGFSLAAGRAGGGAVTESEGRGSGVRE